MLCRGPASCCEMQSASWLVSDCGYDGNRSSRIIQFWIHEVKRHLLALLAKALREHWELEALPAQLRTERAV